MRINSLHLTFPHCPSGIPIVKLNQKLEDKRAHWYSPHKSASIGRYLACEAINWDIGSVKAGDGWGRKLRNRKDRDQERPSSRNNLAKTPLLDVAVAFTILLISLTVPSPFGHTLKSKVLSGSIRLAEANSPVHTLFPKGRAEAILPASGLPGENWDTAFQNSHN